MSGLRLSTILLRLQEDKVLCEGLSLDQAVDFIQLAAQLKEDIAQAQPASHSSDTIPPTISPTISKFLAESLNLSLPLVGRCWGAFGGIAWHWDIAQRSLQNLTMYEHHGWQNGLGEY